MHIKILKNTYFLPNLNLIKCGDSCKSGKSCISQVMSKKPSDKGVRKYFNDVKIIKFNLDEKF